MRKIIFAVIVFIVLATAWTLYLKHDTERFIESLPKVPAATQTQDTKDRSIIDENNDLSHSKRVMQDVLEDFDEEPAAAASTQNRKDKKNDTSALIDVADEFSEQNSIAEWSLQGAEEEYLEEEPIRVINLSKAEIVENNRKWLIEIHGDIPEVHTFLKYFPFEAILNPENKDPFTFTMNQEESLAYKKALAVLFPSEANQKHYQNALEMYEKFRGNDSQKH